MSDTISVKQPAGTPEAVALQLTMELVRASLVPKYQAMLMQGKLEVSKDRDTQMENILGLYALCLQLTNGVALNHALGRIKESASR